MTISKSFTFAALAVVIASAGSVVAFTSYAADENSTSSSTASPASAAYVSDSAITAKVKAALSSNKLSAISVTTELGVVALTGMVATEELRQQATKIAASIDGVRGVDYAGLSVKSTEAISSISSITKSL